MATSAPEQAKATKTSHDAFASTPVSAATTTPPRASSIHTSTRPFGSRSSTSAATPLPRIGGASRASISTATSAVEPVEA